MFNKDLHKSVFSIYSIRKIVFRLSVFYNFGIFYFEFDLIFVDILCNIYVIIVYLGAKCSMVFFLPKSFQVSLLVLALFIKTKTVLQKTCF